jgi:hypothetical protein
MGNKRKVHKPEDAVKPSKKRKVKKFYTEAELRSTAVPFVPNEDVRIFNLSGPTNSGKTYFVNHYLQKEAHHYDYIYVFSPTCRIKDDLFKDVPDHIMEVVHKIENVNDATVDQVFDSAYDTSCMLKENPNPNLMHPDVLMIFDDCLDMGVLRQRGPCERLAERGRQTRLQQIYTSQGVKAHSNRIRDNATYSLLWSPDSISQLEKFIFEFVPKALRKELWPMIDSIFQIPYAFVFIDTNEKQPLRKLKWSTTHDLLDRRQAFLFPFERVDAAT